MIMNTPVMTPPPPIPATILPKINISLEGAVAHITLPTSNIAIAYMNTVLRLKYWYALPHADWKAVLVMEYDEPYQAMLLMLPNSVVMLGIAVALS